MIKYLPRKKVRIDSLIDTFQRIDEKSNIKFCIIINEISDKFKKFDLNN